MKEGLVYLHNTFCDLQDAKIPITDLGVMRGCGVFDYLRTYHGKPLHLDDHLGRLQASAKLLGLELPITTDKIQAIIFEMLEKANYSESSIRIVLTGGQSDSGILYEHKPTLAIIVYPFETYFPLTKYQSGIKLMSYSHLRTFPKCKTLNYLPATVGLQKALKEGFDDLIYVNDKNHLLEATTSNFFAIKGHELLTPKEGILCGITRKIVLRLAENKYSTKQREIDYQEIQSFDEAFICASNKEIVPVVGIDKHKISGGQVGSQTKELMKQFKEYALAKVS